MSDSNTTAQDDGQGKAGNAAVVPLGSKMPIPAKKLPVLGGSQASEGAAPSQQPDDPKLPRSEIADGLNFAGNAVLTGVCTVKGRVQGNLTQAADARITVVVTETGHVKGDIVADQISVMGRTEGLLDATGGSVSLHDSANVSGHVRYFRLQVNGSELNATLERAPSKAAAPAPQASAAPASQLVQAARTAQGTPAAAPDSGNGVKP